MLWKACRWGLLSIGYCLWKWVPFSLVCFYYNLTKKIVVSPTFASLPCAMNFATLICWSWSQIRICQRFSWLPMLINYYLGILLGFIFKTDSGVLHSLLRVFFQFFKLAGMSWALKFKSTDSNFPDGLLQNQSWVKSCVLVFFVSNTIYHTHTHACLLNYLDRSDCDTCSGNRPLYENG